MVQSAEKSRVDVVKTNIGQGVLIVLTSVYQAPTLAVNPPLQPFKSGNVSLPAQRLLFSFAILLTGVLLTPAAVAQIALLDVPGSSGTTLFQLNDDAALVSFGEVGTGTIPATGAGVRLMWYPGKAAFRVGIVSGTQWDDVNIANTGCAMC